MAATLVKFLGKIHQGDCVAGLKKVPYESVDLAFADPPFNIGFEYCQYDDQLGYDQFFFVGDNYRYLDKKRGEKNLVMQ